MSFANLILINNEYIVKLCPFLYSNIWPRTRHPICDQWEKNIFNPLKANWVSLHQWTTKQVLQKRLWSSRSITHLKTTRRVRGILWQSLWIRSSTSPWTQRWIPPRKQSGGGRERSGQEKNRLYGDHRVIVLILRECYAVLFDNDHCSLEDNNQWFIRLLNIDFHVHYTFSAYTLFYVITAISYY